MKQVKNKKQSRDLFSLLILTMLYFSVTVGAINPIYFNMDLQANLRIYSVLYCSFYFIIRLFIKSYRSELKIIIPIPYNWINKLLFLFWIIFGILIINSQLLSGNLPIGGLGYIIYIPIVFFTAIPKTLNNSISSILKALMISGLLFLIWSVSIVPELNTSAYRGIFLNPNGFGMVASQTAIASLCLLFEKIKSKDHDTKFVSRIYFIILLLSVFLLLLSNSRTTFLAVLLSVFIVIFIYLFENNIRLSHLVTVMIGVLIIPFTPLWDYFQSGVLNKFTIKTSASNVLSGREAIWEKIIQERKPFGHGSNYFNESIGIGAHNSVLHFVGEYGTYVGLALSLFFVWTILSSIIYFKNNLGNRFNFVPIVYIIYFLIMAMFETRFGLIQTAPAMAFYSFIGIILFNYQENTN